MLSSREMKFQLVKWDLTSFLQWGISEECAGWEFSVQGPVYNDNGAVCCEILILYIALVTLGEIGTYLLFSF